MGDLGDGNGALASSRVSWKLHCCLLEHYYSWKPVRLCINLGIRFLSFLLARTVDAGLDDSRVDGSAFREPTLSFAAEMNLSRHSLAKSRPFRNAVAPCRKVSQLPVKTGADTAVKDDGGRTALHEAALNGHEAVVQLLLENGADVAVTDNDGWTALLQTARSGHEAVVRLLLEKEADVDAKHNSGWTALQYAVGNGHEAVASLLLEKGANVAATDERGRTVLHDAAANEPEAMVHF
jgi:ankyrin repeat protein